MENTERLKKKSHGEENCGRQNHRRSAAVSWPSSLSAGGQVGADNAQPCFSPAHLNSTTGLHFQPLSSEFTARNMETLFFVIWND